MLRRFSSLRYALHTLKLYYSHFGEKRYPYYLYLLTVFLTAILAGIVKPILFKDLIDQLLVADDIRAVFFSFIYLYLFVSLLFVLIRYASDYLVAVTLPTVVNNLEKLCFKTFHSKSYDFFSNQYSGSLFAKEKRFIDGFLNLDSLLTRDIFDTLILFVASLSVLAWHSVSLSLIFLLWGILFLLCVLLLLPRKMNYDVLSSAQQTKVSGQFVDTLSNSLNLKIFATYDHEKDRLDTFLNDLAKYYHVSWLYTGKMILAYLMLILIAEGVIFYQGYALYADGQISLGLLVLLYTFIIQISQQLRNLGHSIKQIVRALTGAQEMTELIVEDRNLDPAEGQQSYVEIETPVAIRFQQVEFAYDQTKLFEQLDFTIKPLEKVGLVGGSGGGKTTIMKLMLKLIVPQSGQILLNDAPLPALPREQLSSLVSLVPQEPQMFHRSIFDNLVYGSGVSDISAVRKACEQACILKMIESLPEGFNTLVGERGVKLSTGEKQRLAIARAFLLDTAIVMLDEPTSALDAESEYFIQKALSELFAERTVLVIAHRLATVKKMDRILVLDQGKLVEDGTHQELIARAQLYQQLWQYQVI